MSETTLPDTTVTPKRFRVGCDLRYEIAGQSAFIFNVSIVANSFQKILEESFRTEPEVPVSESRASADEKRLHRFAVGSGSLRVLYSATVELSHYVSGDGDHPEIAPGDLPAEAVPYLYPSRYCESDKLTRLAQREFGNFTPGFSRITAVCNWINHNVEYLRGTTDPRTSAYDTATERAGVCRDFAHLGIAFCRALGVPARFVSGYALGLEPPDFHAYFEAYLGNRWYIFDPTRLAPLTGFVRIGTGHDAADTSFATIFGPVSFSSMMVTMEQIAGEPAVNTTEAVSTS